MLTFHPKTEVITDLWEIVWQAQVTRPDQIRTDPDKTRLDTSQARPDTALLEYIQKN